VKLKVGITSSFSFLFFFFSLPSLLPGGVVTPGFDNYYFVSSPTQIALVQLLSSFTNATIMFANLSDLNTWETVALPDLSYLGWDLVPSLTYAADHWYFMGSVYDRAFIFQSLDLKQWDVVYDGPCQDQKKM
jgi:hypothetical protein